MSNKKQRRDEAFSHMADTQSRLRENTEQSLRELVLYEESTLHRAAFMPTSNSTAVTVEACDSVSAVMSAPAGVQVGLLDFASYRYPGGGFANGALAQEEALCMESNLYDILSRMESEYYVPNRSRTNRSLYSARSMYVPRVVFERGESAREVDVLVMAAPNWKAAMNHGVEESECLSALSERIQCVMSMAAMNGVGHLVLGAFGCGVFGNDPETVAKMFKEWLNVNPGVIPSVVFAVPGGANLSAFRAVFSEERA